MDVLLNPNVAYLVLAFGMLLAIMAVLTPGTGVFEIAALFMFLFVGWYVFVKPTSINFWAFGFLALGSFFYLVALRRFHEKVYLIVALLCLVIGTYALFGGDEDLVTVNPLLGVLIAFVTGGFAWIVTSKTLEAREMQPSHDLQRLIGAVGEAKTDIQTEGTVQVLGELWTAYSRVRIRAGAGVRVIDRQGFRLEVEPVKSEIATPLAEPD